MDDDEPVGLIRIGKPPSAPPLRNRRPYRIAVLAGLAVLVLAMAAATAGILVARSDAEAQASPTRSSTPSASPPSSPSGPYDAAGREACRLVKEAALTDQLMLPKTVAAILEQAKSSHSFKVQFHAQMLHNQQEIAIAGGKDHPAYVLELHSEALEMETDCVTEGLSD